MDRFMAFLALVVAAVALPVAANGQSTQQQVDAAKAGAARVAGSTGVPLWVWIVVIVVVLAAIVLLAVARRRRAQAVIKTRLG